MQRLVIVFVGILSVVWATPFGLDGVDRPTMMRDTWVEEVGFGNEALSEDPEHKDDYEIGTFKAHESTNIIAKSDKGQPLRDGAMDLTGVFGDDIEECPKHDKLPEDGCAKIIQDSLHLINIMSGIDDVYSIAKVLAQLPECLFDDDLHLITKEPCYQLDKKGRDIISFYNWFTNIRYKDDVNVNDYNIGTFQTDEESDEGRSLSDGAIDLSEVVGDLDNCNYPEEVPDEGCVVIFEDSLHLINTLNGNTMDGVAEVLKQLPKCLFDEVRHVTTKEPCFSFEIDDEGYDIISFFNWFTNIRYKDDVYNYEILTFKTYDISNIIAKSDEGRSLSDGAIDLSEVVGDIDNCDYTEEIPDEGCVVIVQDSLHLINTLNGNTMDGVAEVLKKVPKCIFDEEKHLTTKEPCFRFEMDDKGYEIISFFNWFTNIRHKNDDVYDFKIGTFKAHENFNIIAKSDKGQPLRDGAMDLTGVFGDAIEECPKHDKLPEDGCAKIIQDSLHLINIMSGIDDVYSIAKLLGQLPECQFDDDLHLITKEPCYQLDKKGRDIISFYNWFTNIRYKDDVNVNNYKIGTLQTYKHFNIIAKSDEDRSLSDGAIDLSDVVGDIDNCVYGEEIPDEGCVVIVQDSLHLINTLNGDNMDGIAETLKKIPKCLFDEEKQLTTKEPCYRYEMDDKGYEIISFFNWFTNIRYKDNDVYDYGETRYVSPDAEVPPQSSVPTTTGDADLQQLILKGLLKRQSSVAKTSKSLLLKKIQSRQQPKEAQKKRRLQGQQHGSISKQMIKRDAGLQKQFFIQGARGKIKIKKTMLELQVENFQLLNYKLKVDLLLAEQQAGLPRSKFTEDLG